MTLTDTSTPWAFQVSALSDRLAANLDKREYLLDVADRVLKVARDESCTTLVGASEAGRRIVEAALGRDHGMDGPIRGSMVLVVDGLLATGTNLVATADRVREEGAAGIAIVAALADRTGLQAVELEVGGKVVALEMAG